MVKDINIGGRLHSIVTGNVVAGADEILDDNLGKKQTQINVETYNLVESINNALAELSPDQQEALGVATKANANEAKLGYYICDTAAGTAAKIISATGYVLTNGGSMKIKMTNENTVDNATLNINSTGAKALYYAGERASSINTWEAGETVEVYYDGTNFYANNVAGGSGMDDGVFDVSVKYPTSGVEGGNTYTLDGALAALNANLSDRKKKGGMSIKFIQSSDNKYVQYRYMGTATTGSPNPFLNEVNWQGVDDVPTNNSDNLVKSGGVFSGLNPLNNEIFSEVQFTDKVLFSNGDFIKDGAINSNGVAISTQNSYYIDHADVSSCSSFDVYFNATHPLFYIVTFDKNNNIVEKYKVSDVTSPLHIDNSTSVIKTISVTGGDGAFNKRIVGTGVEKVGINKKGTVTMQNAFLPSLVSDDKALNNVIKELYISPDSEFAACLGTTIDITIFKSYGVQHFCGLRINGVDMYVSVSQAEAETFTDGISCSVKKGVYAVIDYDLLPDNGYVTYKFVTLNTGVSELKPLTSIYKNITSFPCVNDASGFNNFIKEMYIRNDCPIYDIVDYIYKIELRAGPLTKEQRLYCYDKNGNTVYQFAQQTTYGIYETDKWRLYDFCGLYILLDLQATETYVRKEVSSNIYTFECLSISKEITNLDNSPFIKSYIESSYTSIANPLMTTIEKFNSENINQLVVENIFNDFSGNIVVYMAPVVCISNNAIPLVAAEGRVALTDSANSQINVARYVNGSWDITTIFPITLTDEKYMNPSFVVDRTGDHGQTGRIYLFAAKNTSNQTVIGSDPQYTDCVYKYSDDNGATWSQEYSIKSQWKNTFKGAIPSSANGIQLSDGTLVVPAMIITLNNKWASGVFYKKPSDTDWIFSNPTLAGNECCVYQYNNTIRLDCRLDDSKRLLYIYNIEADSWRGLFNQFETIAACDTSILYDTIKSHDMFLKIAVDGYKRMSGTVRAGRKNMTLWMSEDGQKWMRVLRFNSSESQGYAGIAYYNNHLYATYCESNYTVSVVCLDNLLDTIKEQFEWELPKSLEYRLQQVIDMLLE